MPAAGVAGGNLTTATRHCQHFARLPWGPPVLRMYVLLDYDTAAGQPHSSGLQGCPYPRPPPRNCRMQSSWEGPKLPHGQTELLGRCGTRQSLQEHLATLLCGQERKRFVGLSSSRRRHPHDASEPQSLFGGDQREGVALRRQLDHAGGVWCHAPSWPSRPAPHTSLPQQTTSCRGLDVSSGVAARPASSTVLSFSTSC